MKYLIVVAHPDDEVLGVGATIKKLTNDGNEVAVAIMVQNAEARKDLSNSLLEDQNKSMKILGVNKVYSSFFPNIKMNTIPHLDLVQSVEKYILEFQPDIIITHHPYDTNDDHVKTSYAVQAACRLFQRRNDVKPIKELLFMEVLSSTEWSLDSSANRFTPNYFVEVGENLIDIKIKALGEYKGVMRPFPHPRSVEAIKGLAAYRGAQSGCNYAEAFELVIKRVI